MASESERNILATLSLSPSPTPPKIYNDREIEDICNLGDYKFDGITMGVCAMNKKVYRHSSRKP